MVVANNSFSPKSKETSNKDKDRDRGKMKEQSEESLLVTDCIVT